MVHTRGRRGMVLLWQKNVSPRLWRREVLSGLLVLTAALGLVLSAILTESPAKAALPAPGGIDSGLIAWQKADDGTTNSASTVWIDSSGSGNDANRQASAFVDNGINFNPAWDMAGNSAFVYSNNLGVVGTNNFSSIAAYRHDEAATGIYFGHTGSGANDNFMAFSTNTGASGVGRSGPGGTCGSTSSTTEAVGIPRIGGYTRAYPSITTHLNGGGMVTGTCSNSITGTTRQLGKRVQVSVSEGRFTGLIGEFVHYNRDLTTAELSRINSYLAIKYGVTLDQSSPQNYVASDGTTAPWDGTANAAYRHNITGIGRDDNSALNQKQSKSVNPQGIVTIGHGTIATDNISNTNDFAGDLTFLLFGDDNQAATTWTDAGLSPTFADYKRIPRTWKAQKTNTTGDFAISFDVNDPDAEVPDAIENYYFINLTTNELVPLTSVDGNNFSASGITLNDGDEFTLATFDAEYNVRYRKTVSPVLTAIPPSQPFTYTVTVENLGNTPLTGLSFTDNLSNVVDDATYNNDAAADIGTVMFNGPDQIEWNGDVGVGQTATITYSFTMNDPTTGDGSLINGIIGTGPGSNCTEDPVVDPDCQTITPLPVVTSQKTLVSPASPQAGDTVNYQFTITNQGGAAAGAVTAADELTDVLDDAVYNYDASASSGSLSFNPLTRRLSWNGSLAANGDPGDTVTVTFSVTVDAPEDLDDAMLNNALISHDCPNPPIFDSGAPGYDADCVTSTPVTAWFARKTVTPSGDVDPGTAVEYTIAVENTGAVDLTGGSAPSVDDDLTDVLDDAAYNNDESATSGTPTFTSPTLNWSGDLLAGESATVTYSVTVNQEDDLANARLANTIAGPLNCPSPPTANPSDPNFNPDCAVLSQITTPEPPSEPENPSGPTGSNDGGADGGLAGTGQSIVGAIVSALVIIGGSIFTAWRLRTKDAR